MFKRNDRVRVKEVSRVATMLWNKTGKVTNVGSDNWVTVDLDGVKYSFKQNELRRA